MIFQIEHLAFEELSSFLRLQAEDTFPDLKDEERLKMLAEKWSKNAECSTCRDDDGQLVGMIAFYANGQGADFAYIPHVYVSPEFRNRGLFARMLNAVEQYVKLKGFGIIRLEVAKNNEKAKNAYIRNGFHHSKDVNENSSFMIKVLLESM
jgi:ribosomal protein S18 acetylase RimI-like enzyme